MRLSDGFSYLSRHLCIWSILLLGIFAVFPAQAQFYQGYQNTFGKNRVQYGEKDWTFYRFKNFDTYFYLGGHEQALFIGRTADKHLDEIEKLVDYRLDGRIQFVIYNKFSDLKQSNIGLEGDEVANNTGGLTRIIGNKVLLHFDGDHQNFIKQMRAGIAQVLIDQLFYGGSVKDRVQNAVLLNLPQWYSNGLISYISESWSSTMDDRLRDAIVHNRYKKFNRLAGEDAVIAGHSFWKFIVDTYGRSAISNMLYLTRVNRNIDSGFLFVLGTSLKNLSKNWLEYYQKIYFNADKDRTLPGGEPVLKKTKQDIYYSQLRLNNDGTKVAYVANDRGKYKVRIVSIADKKSKRIFKGGYRSDISKRDVSFPLLAWHPTGRILTVINESKGKTWLNMYDLEKKKITKSPLFYFEKVLQASYSDDGQSLVISAIQKGQSDIFVFNLRSRTYEQITNDFYDDLYPRFVNDGRSIAFSSNRINDTLGVDKKDDMPADSNLDIFLYDYAKKSSVLNRITNTQGVDEIQSMPYDSAGFSFLSNENGIYNRYIGTLDSVIAFIDTTEHYRYIIQTIPQSNYSRNIIEQDVSYRKNRYASIYFSEGKYQLKVEPLPPPIFAGEPGRVTPFMKTIRDEFAERIPAPSTVPVNDSIIPTVPVNAPGNVAQQLQADSSKIDISNYVFQNDVTRSRKKSDDKDSTRVRRMNFETEYDSLLAKSIEENGQEILPKQRNYDVSYEPNFLVSQLDNSLLNSTYQYYTGGAVYFDPGLNGLFKIGITDLMQDYKITGGIRVSGDFNSNEYLLTYDNLLKRVDKTVSFYRQSRLFTDGFTFLRVHTHEAKYVAKYPFSDIAAIRGTVGYRNDRIAVLSSDLRNLQRPNEFDHWGSLKAEFVYDNTLSTGVNLYNGTRYKIFAEMFKQIDEKDANTFILGADFRTYTKIHRQIIWANRFATSTSFGEQKLIYYLGSTDNALVPTDNFNSNISVDQTQNYVFQAVATNMRGFIQNIRNGNSFALINSEIRIPVFQYLLNRPIRSDFINNFQIVAFGDVGTAWTGNTPYSSDNNLNTQTVINNPITISITKQIEPIVAGYGAGLRTRIFGYFIRADWAWGYDDGAIKDPIFYLSLSLDF